ncbi:helix-turn-helix domain-containing protein [Rhizobium sp. RHZ02]|nr:helix-turn-helix domain-containing protein [Rhizobium sp. RHZ02]
MTLEELAEATGISVTHLSRIEARTRGFSLENVIKVARALGVDPSELTDEYDHEQLTEASNMPMGAIPADGAANDAIPEIDLVAGLGGGGISIVENTTQNGITFHRESVRDHWRVPEWMLGRMGVRPPHVAAFPSRGDSMTPTIEDGDVVFIDTRHRVPSPPGIYALADEFGGVVVKRLEVTSRPGDEMIKVQISSDNPRHTTRELNLDEIQIVGRYIGRFTI